LRIGIAALLSLGAQGLVLVSAIENDDAWRWWIWAALLMTLIVLFVMESRNEGQRRRRIDDGSAASAPRGTD
jgi:hypothetical protein